MLAVMPVKSGLRSYGGLRTILSALLKVEVLTVEVRPHEYSDENRDSLSVFRIDFGATIRDVNGRISDVSLSVKKVRFAEDTNCFIVTTVDGTNSTCKCIDIKGITFERLLSERYYKVLNLFHQMYQINNEKHILTHLESIYSQEDDLLSVLHSLEALLNEPKVIDEMKKEDTISFFQNKNQLIELLETKLDFYVEMDKKQKTQLAEQQKMLQSSIKMLLNAGMTPEQTSTNLGVELEIVQGLA